MAILLGSPPTLSNWQLSLNGVLTLGAGTPYTIDSIDGLGMPDVRNGDIARPRADGEFAGLDLLPGRDITLNLTVSSNDSSLQSALLALNYALPPGGTTEVPLWWQEPNLPIMSTLVRVRKRPRTIDMPYSVGTMATVALMLHATDPNLYGATQFATAQSTHGPLGGLGFPFGFPFGFGAGGGVGTVTVNNTGNRTTYPILKLTGPCTNPVVQNLATGGFLAFTISLGDPGVTGDVLAVDTDTHAISLSNFATPSPGVNRRSALNAGWQWFGLVPGSNTLTVSGGGGLFIEYAPAYII